MITYERIGWLIIAQVYLNKAEENVLRIFVS